MGAAYRASGRTLPLFDTYAPPPVPGALGRASVGHAQRRKGDLARGHRPAARRAARGVRWDGPAGRPTTASRIWYLETGYQTQIDDAKQSLYRGVENWPGSLPDRVPGAAQAKPPDDARRPIRRRSSRTALRCLLPARDRGGLQLPAAPTRPDLEGWQSGLLWADGTRKDSYDAFRSIVSEVNERRVDCSELKGAPGIPGSAVTAKSAAAPAATRALTKVSYRSGKVVPYGFLQPRAQLTLGVTASKNGLAGKQLLFLLGGTAYVGVTDRAGTASVAPMPPPKPGRYRVGVRFSGDPVNLASGLQVGVRVVNSKGRVSSVGAIRVGPAARAEVSARSDGRKPRGTLVLTGRGPKKVVRLTALGLRSDARAVWLNGTDGKKRYLLNIERVAGKPAFRVRIWRDGVLLFRPARVPAKSLHLSR